MSFWVNYINICNWSFVCRDSLGNEFILKHQLILSFSWPFVYPHFVLCICFSHFSLLIDFVFLFNHKIATTKTMLFSCSGSFLYLPFSTNLRSTLIFLLQTELPVCCEFLFQSTFLLILLPFLNLCFFHYSLYVFFILLIILFFILICISFAILLCILQFSLLRFAYLISSYWFLLSIFFSNLYFPIFKAKWWCDSVVLMCDQMQQTKHENNLNVR